MSWLAENWVWVLFGVAFIAMHFFGHGGHGRHGGHGSHRGGHCGGGGQPQSEAEASRPLARPGETAAHRR